MKAVSENESNHKMRDWKMKVIIKCTKKEPETSRFIEVRSLERV